MKYVYTLIFVSLMYWTWNLASANDFSMEAHYNMQNQVQDIVSDLLSKQRPGVSDIRFEQTYPEVILPGQEIHYHFRVAFNENLAKTGPTLQNLEAIAILKKKADEDLWQWQEVNIGKSQIWFQEGIVISQKDFPSTSGAGDQVEPINEAPATDHGHK